jgi:3D (Asp-Asp-Asp) domain-containing protein
LAQIRIVNELSGTNDHVIVNGLQAGDIMKVYPTEKAAAPTTQATVASGSDTADATLPQLGLVEGSVYVTITSPPLQESLRVAKQFRPEPITASPSPGMIVVVNEPTGTADRIELSGLSNGDVVKVYADAASTSVIGTVTAGSDSTKAIVSITQLGKQAGHVYVTVTSSARGESSRIVKAYAAELASGAPDRSDIQIHNAVGTEDTITFTGLQLGDTVKVYAADASAVPIGSAVVADGATSAVVEAALPGTGYGIIYMTVTHSQEEESARTAKIYAAEPLTLPLSANQLRISNMVGAFGNDEVSAIAIKPGDTIKVYADSVIATPIQTVMGVDASASAAIGATTATISNLQLSEGGGRVYVTVMSQGKRESSRTVKAYEAE